MDSFSTKYGIRKWNKFHKKNKENRSDCQLVTALNVYYYLYGKTIGQNTKTYEKLTDLCHTRTGSAINICDVYAKYKIEIIKNTHMIDTDIICDLLPLEVSIWHKAYGLHSILIVDYEPKTCAIRILNADKMEQVNLNGWIFLEDFQHYKKFINGWVSRSFKSWDVRY